MLIFRTREELDHAIVTMYNEGWGKRALARHFKMSRNTIRNILSKYQNHREKGQSALGKSNNSRKSKLDEHIPRIQELLEDYPNITGQRLFEELKDDGFTGGLTIVRQRLAKLRPHPKKKPIIRFETLPGEQSQMDWSPYTLHFAKEGKLTVNCFSYILGFSRRQYIDFTRDRKFFTLIRRHQDAFAYFGGVTRHCLYDGEKTVILRWEAGRPVYNPRFISFITHYLSKPVGCRPGSPETKGKVEAPFKYIESNLLNARTFEDLEDLRQTARWWMTNRSDCHVHDTTGQPPLERFLEQEQTALIRLPHHPYDSSEVVLRVGRLDGFIEYETNFYSIPFEYVADILAVKVGEHEVNIYSPDLDLIACHERLPDGMSKSRENPDHRRCVKVKYGLEPVKDSFLALGEFAESFLSGLQMSQPRNCGFHARIILAMKENYHADDINKALKHAIGYYAFDGKAIGRILAATARKRTLESFRNEKARYQLEQALPSIRQRSLGEYSDLISRGGNK
jgi:transposase